MVLRHSQSIIVENKHFNVNDLVVVVVELQSWNKRGTIPKPNQTIFFYDFDAKPNEMQRLHNPDSRHIHFYAFPLAILLFFFMVTTFESFGRRIHVRKRQESIIIRFSKSLEMTAIPLLYIINYLFVFSSVWWFDIELVNSEQLKLFTFSLALICRFWFSVIRFAKSSGLFANLSTVSMCWISSSRHSRALTIRIIVD